MQDSIRTAATSGPPAAPQTEAPSYWYELIPEKPAAAFLNLTARTLQGYRYKGGGPRFVRISGRCVKYRRIDLRGWTEERLRSSTSDPGKEAA